MRSLAGLTALSVGVLLLSAPAVSTCGEFGATMTSKCPMMAEMSGSMATSICHGDGQMAKDCCEVQSAPQPMQALTFASSKLLTAPQAIVLKVVEPPAPAAPVPISTPADGFRLHDLGRYTLFSSFLL